MTLRNSTRVRHLALIATSAVVLCSLGQAPADAAEREPGTAAPSERPGRSSSQQVQLRRQAASLEQRLRELETASRLADERVARLAKEATGLAEQADRAAAEADALYARAMSRDPGMLQALVDLVRRRESDLDLAMAALQEQRQTEGIVAIAVAELATARGVVAEAEAAWAAAVAEIADVETAISSYAVARLSMAQAGFAPAYQVQDEAQDALNRGALQRWRRYLSSLADAGVVPPPAAEVERPDKLVRPLQPVHDAAGRPAPGIAQVARRGRAPLPVLPRETVRAVSEAFSRIGTTPAADPAGYACGGLLRQVWARAEVRLPRHSDQQWRTLQRIRRGAVQVGDAVYPVADGYARARRAGIYVGAGQMIVAEAGTGEVVVQDMSTGELAGVRRVPLPRPERRSSAPRTVDVVTDCGPPETVEAAQLPFPDLTGILPWATEQAPPWAPPPAPLPLPTPLPSPAPAPAGQTGPAVPSRGQFTIASFNVLGDSHTRPGGNRPGWADSSTRMRWAVELLGQRGVDVAGFQEFQPPQARDFQRMTGGTWDIYSIPNNTQNAVAWKRSQFALVSGRTVSIPYFNGKMERMPVVRLRFRATGQELYLANFHNPASTARHPGNEKWRDEATRREMALVEQLRPSGIPILITGDMNERDEFFCRFSASQFMHAAAGGSHAGRCEPPTNVGVDWIFGSRDVTFSGYVQDRSALVRRATDHPLVVSGVTLTPPP